MSGVFHGKCDKKMTEIDESIYPKFLLKKMKMFAKKFRNHNVISVEVEMLPEDAGEAVMAVAGLMLTKKDCWTSRNRQRRMKLAKISKKNSK